MLSKLLLVLQARMLERHHVVLLMVGMMVQVMLAVMQTKVRVAKVVGAVSAAVGVLGRGPALPAAAVHHPVGRCSGC